MRIIRDKQSHALNRELCDLLTTIGTRMRKPHGRYVEVYEPYQVILNMDEFRNYSKTYVTTDSDQIGHIYLGQEELKVLRTGHNAMMEHDAVHIENEADVTANRLSTDGKKMRVTGLLDT